MSDSIEQAIAKVRLGMKNWGDKVRSVDTGVGAITLAASYVSRANISELMEEGLLNRGNLNEFYREVVDIMVSKAFETMTSQSHSANLIAPYPTLIVIGKTIPGSVEGVDGNDIGEYPYSSFLPHLMRGYKKYFRSLHEAYDNGERKNISLKKLFSVVEELEFFATAVCRTDPPGEKALIKLDENIQGLRDLCLKYFAKQPGKDSVYQYEADKDESLSNFDL